MPKEATIDRRLIETLGLASFVAIPMSVEGELIGSLGFGNSKTDHGWLRAEVDVLSTLAQLITGALRQQQSFDSLKESEGRYRTVASYAAELVFDSDLEALEELAVMRSRHQVMSLYEREEESYARGSQELVGESQALTAIHHHVSRVAPTDSTVLILGETGTGKELVARAVHRASLRAHRIMVKVDCGALPPTLIESELFGHEKGSFTGAIKRKLGLFELADGGTIFLDEIGDLPIELQAKLLRVLQEGEFVRIGSTELRQVDVRVIAATNRPLDEAMKAGEFRPDLFYRLSVFPIEIPPLRNRREDIPVLVHHFLKKTTRKLSRQALKVPRELMESFTAYDWPGNVRELENLIECAAVFSTGNTLSLPYALVSRLGAARGGASVESLQDMERRHIAGVLRACNWRVKGKGNAAERLQLNPSTLYSRMRKLGLKRPD
jgi:transcriptional regulator with GAF, ATPase, and Fis domain